jgi:hypothetical protein
LSSLVPTSLSSLSTQELPEHRTSTDYSSFDPLTNAGGVIADLFSANERGLAMSVFSAAPFMGPVLGPIIGGFLGMTEGW